MQAIYQICILFSLIIVGIIVGKKNLVSENFKSDTSKMILNIFLPALIIKSMNFKFSNEMFIKSIKMVLISALVYIISIGISIIFSKIFKLKGERKNVFEYALIFSNAAFMGFPVLNQIYGTKALFYGVIFNLGFTFTIWTYGVYIYERGKNETVKRKLSEKIKHILNPGIVAMIIGFTLFSLNIKLPNTIYKILELLGNMTTPAAMIFIGLILTETKINEIFKDKFISIISISRLIILPAIVYLILGLMGFDKLMLNVAVVVTAMPVAANTAIFAQRHQSDYKLASLIIFQSTALSAISIPILVLLLK